VRISALKFCFHSQLAPLHPGAIARPRHPAASQETRVSLVGEIKPRFELIGGAAHVDSIKTRVETAYGVCNHRLKQLSTFAFSFNLRRYVLGVRVPDSDFVRAVSKQYGTAIALTSANESGARSTLDVQEFNGLW